MTQMAELEHIKPWGLRLHQVFFLQVATASGCYGDIDGHFARASSIGSLSFRYVSNVQARSMLHEEDL